MYGSKEIVEILFVYSVVKIHVRRLAFAAFDARVKIRIGGNPAKRSKKRPKLGDKRFTAQFQPFFV